jgi:hypothetical protein
VFDRFRKEVDLHENRKWLCCQHKTSVNLTVKVSKHSRQYRGDSLAFQLIPSSSNRSCGSHRNEAKCCSFCFLCDRRFLRQMSCHKLLQNEKDIDAVK